MPCLHLPLRAHQPGLRALRQCAPAGSAQSADGASIRCRCPRPPLRGHHGAAIRFSAAGRLGLCAWDFALRGTPCEPHAAGCRRGRWCFAGRAARPRATARIGSGALLVLRAAPRPLPPGVGSRPAALPRAGRAQLEPGGVIARSSALGAGALSHGGGGSCGCNRACSPSGLFAIY